VKVYRIRRRFDGLFATGGWHTNWTKTGKVFIKLGSILRLVADDDEQNRKLSKSFPDTKWHPTFEGCDILEYELKDPKIIESF